MIYLLAILLSIFFLYDTYSKMLYRKLYHKNPKSMSATAALHEKPLFMLVTTILAFGLLPIWLHAMPAYQFLAFISCVGLLFVGHTPNYETSKTERIIHFLGAYTGSIATILVIILNGHWVWLFPIPLYMILCLADDVKNWTYWFELGLFWSIFLGLSNVLI